MPRYASIGCFTLEYTLLAARFRAAQNPLIIPKVLHKAVKSRLKHCLKNTVLPCFIDVLPGYPCWEP